jgi:three-Cys-motif partner protein
MTLTYFMLVKRVTGPDWLKKGIGALEVTNLQSGSEIKEILNIKPDVYNVFREWTPLKLILLNYAFHVCSTIINKMTFFKHKYYVDLFAGSGINKMKGKDDFLIGSPLIVSLSSHSALYDQMCFCEKDPNYSEALNLRLEFLKKKNLMVQRREYETCFDEILASVNQRDTYSFFFIDPNCMEFKWESMKKVLKSRSDIIFNFMSSQIYRDVCLKKEDGKGNELLELFGDDSWKQANNVDELVEIYKCNILKERRDAPIRTIRIHSSRFNFCYHLFFITNKTKGENQWLRAIDKAKTEIESNSDKAVMLALDIVKHRQKLLFEE